VPSAWDRLRYWLQARRRARQRRDLRTRLMIAWAALHEARQYVLRDRRAERAERDRLVRQIDAGRRAAEAVVEALQARALGGAVSDEELLRAAETARDVLSDLAQPLGQRD
jgi:hypothetical protein